MSMPTKNIEWTDITKDYKVDIRWTLKGGNSYYVVTDKEGTEYVPSWNGRDAREAQFHLNRLAAQ